MQRHDSGHLFFFYCACFLASAEHALFLLQTRPYTFGSRQHETNKPIVKTHNEPRNEQGMHTNDQSSHTRPKN